MITESAALGLVCTRARPVNDDGVARSTNIANGELHHMSLEDLRSYYEPELAYLRQYPSLIE